MSRGNVPLRPKIYHITHLDNLPAILESGCLWSDAKRLELGLATEIVGISGIKARRLKDRPVKCHPDTRVGEYVPFNFCPRSVMLYILHMGNRPGLSYHGGQQPIVHLVADMQDAVTWAQASGRPWSFSDRNAGTWYAAFFCSLGDLGSINWDAVRATDFRDPVVKDGKQAEFLVHECFSWHLVERIGVYSKDIQESVEEMMAGADHQPAVSVERSWYY